MREQSPGKVEDDDLVLHCTLDLSCKIKNFLLVIVMQ
jgi:hypothetical protein